MMQIRRVAVVVGVALFVLLAYLAPAAYAGRALDPLPPSAQAAAPSAAGPFKLYLPVVRTSGAEARFWADQYTLPAAGCTTLHWKVVLAKAVYLDGVGVPAVGSQQTTCPSASSQFYTLEVVDYAGVTTTYEVVLNTGTPVLGQFEVIAQGAVTAVTPIADADPYEAGAQPGYQLRLNNIKPLFVGQAGWAPTTVMIDVTQSLLDAAAFGAPVDWPIAARQSVEFRATCAGSICTVSEADPESYLYLRSE